jgi:hypothetical protein
MEEMYMKKVIEFPQDRSLENRLHKNMEELAELHDALSKGYNLLQTLEDQVEEKESEYNGILVKYARAVGIENIPVGLLDFASEHLVVDVESGEIRYEPPEET